MFDYIIVQAGGKGSRLKQMTYNKPKALVSIKNLPMIFHLFKKFPEKKFIIIGDYKFDVLEKYLKCFAEVDYTLISGGGLAGTLAGLDSAISLIDDKSSFMLIWCDLVLDDKFLLPDDDSKNYIGISQSFPCRWRFENGKFEEISSNTSGVAGLFMFKNKSVLKDMPQDGEFVRYLSTQNISFETIKLTKTQEYGLLDVVEGIERPKCRPFNQMIVQGDKIIKTPLDKQGVELAAKEKNWYKFITENSADFVNLPKIYSFDPLTLERIVGDGDSNSIHLYNSQNLSKNDKSTILKQIVDTLKKIHNIASVETDFESFVDAYLLKTYKRLEKIKNLVPFANKEKIVINGKECRNILFNWDKVSRYLFESYPKHFSVIHGDCTFSNILLGKNNRPVLIDPRGYFGKTQIYGDEAYDWAKLYYSIVGNYDQFNLGKFVLQINENDVELKINSSGWEDMEEEFFSLLKGIVNRRQIKLIHIIIWYSLTTYAWNDYDSICGAFYRGSELLENFLKEVEK